MKRVFLLRQLLLLLAGILGINVVLALRAYRDPARLLVHALDTSPPVTDLFLGNSLMAAGLDVPAYEHAAPGARALNAALGATLGTEHDLLLRHALHTSPRRVFYGFFNTQLTDGPVADFGKLIGNRAMVYYDSLDRETAIRLLFPADPVGAWRIRSVSWLPIVVERANLWSKVELLRRWLGGIGLPAERANRFGRSGDFALLDATDEQAFARLCARTTERWTGLSDPVADMENLASRRGAAFCFVEMPMTVSHRRRLYATPEWTAYEAAMRRQAERDGARLVNASDWIADDEFMDALHLSPRGATHFSQRLATMP